MEHLSVIKVLLIHGHFMTKLDLKDAYFSVVVRPESPKFLRFIWENKFQALSFGLNIAPRIFTRLYESETYFYQHIIFQPSRTVLQIGNANILWTSPIGC
jgi:hypothetical protein